MCSSDLMGDCFVSCLVLSINAAREEKGQRHNIFHTCGTIKNKVCSIIVDNGSGNNIASSDLVERLGLKQRRHPSPYKMKWLNDCVSGLWEPGSPVPTVSGPNA